MQIGRYELIAEIARGGMGVVYLAVARGPSRFNKLVVVKELKPDLADDDGFLAMFLEEARLAARLNHRNIVQTHEVGNDGPHHFMVMEHLEGVTLGRILRKPLPRFTLAMHVRVLADTLLGLHYAHTLADYDGTPLGIVHRDATPQNVFVTYDGDVKLVDFGIAKALDSTVETRAGLFKGKPSYMAPEQIRGEADARSDVFTVGVMLWEAVAGQRMWKTSTASDVEILTAMSLGQVPSLLAAAPSAPPALVAIADRALARRREDRFATALEMRAALEGYLASTGDDPTSARIGQVVSEGFAATRAKMRHFIETHLADDTFAAARSRPVHLPPPSMQLESLSEAPARHEPGTLSGATATALSPGMLPPPAALPLPPATLPETSLVPIDVLAPAARRQPRALLVAVGLAAMFAVGGGALAFVRIRSMPGRPSAAAAPARADTLDAAAPDVAASVAPSAAVVEAVPPAEDVLHELAITVQPAGTQLRIDGASAQNPVKKLCHHGNTVVVHATKAGFVTSDRTFVCDRDQTIELALVAVPAPLAPASRGPSRRAASATTATAEPARPVATDVSPSGGTAPRRAIDPHNPYRR